MQLSTHLIRASSLTIREGISAEQNRAQEIAKFPHYTWGYIVLELHGCHLVLVPSLQVRVYRNWESVKVRARRSLTASEGISMLIFMITMELWFPHCKWGYICGLATQWQLDAVPSLLVRVYRWHTNWPVFRAKFPHCKWGYIVMYILIWLPVIVPSLQVRVYRQAESAKDTARSSLTASEGISVISLITKTIC